MAGFALGERRSFGSTRLHAYLGAGIAGNSAQNSAEDKDAISQSLLHPDDQERTQNLHAAFFTDFGFSWTPWRIGSAWLGTRASVGLEADWMFLQSNPAISEDLDGVRALLGVALCASY